MNIRPLLALACAAGLALAGCSREAPPPAEARTAVVRTVGSTEAQQLTVYAGEVRARHESDLAFRIAGKVIERPAALGAKVKKGELLARIDPQDVEANAEAAKAQVVAASSDLALAKAEFDRSKALAEQQFVSGSVVDQRRAALLAAQARLQQARSQSEIASNQASYARLVADRDGTVTATPVDAGQVVAAGQAVVRLAASNEREVQIFIPEKRLAGTAVGAAVLVSPWADKGKVFDGVVREVASAADVATRTYAVRIAVPKADEALSLGSTAAVVFPSAGKPAIVLPHGAIVQNEGQAKVWVVGSDNTLSARAVKLGAYREDGALIESGLANGDRVIVAGAHRLAAGDKIKPVAEPTPVALDIKR
ncbi:efflux RND transporter periplasmic adaptor subunit [Niveibacterium sp. 24ML]|uniref:efflux RND transporter periplasmic adaptor subunit n=1 Tax=Niveibacterium sp. 24ML TaxID=2985512 RepID=UPI00226D89C0|nr:efflux RND transporter periplasmic adaptor subunit [Niveibacterium sp. 24ML]MCX9154540.1 efflux RND transporter periplasmic adaptor subunit [Niveibacterium sp. 24ML]